MRSALSTRDFETFLAQSDIVSVELPAGPATRGFLDRARLERMKPGAFLINVARADSSDPATFVWRATDRDTWEVLPSTRSATTRRFRPAIRCSPSTTMYDAAHRSAAARQRLGHIAEIVQALAHELAPGAAFMEGVR